MVKFTKPSKEESKGFLRYRNREAKALLVDQRSRFRQKKFKDKSKDVKPFRKDLALKEEGPLED